MSGQDESAEKSHEPSQKKLDDARKKGEIPRAPDLSTAMAYLGLLACCVSVGAYSVARFGEALLPFIEQPDRLETLFFKDGATSITGGLLAASIVPTLPILLIPGGFVIASLIASRGLLFTPSKLVFKPSRLSPIENAKNKYGRRGLFEFFKSFLKLTIYSLTLAFFLSTQIDTIIGAARGSPLSATVTMAELMVRFLSIVVVIAMSIGLLDYFWQRGDHLRRNRMSHKEMRDEFKEAEGDPMLKQQRRTRAQEVALNQMMADVPEADVVIVNPTHFAVALKWSRLPGEAPRCVAKGQDAVAARIREKALEANVPIHSDPPTARALFATTEIGAEIATDHYRAVAAAIRFAEAMRVKARQRGWT